VRLYTVPPCCCAIVEPGTRTKTFHFRGLGVLRLTTMSLGLPVPAECRLIVYTRWTTRPARTSPHLRPIPGPPAWIIRAEARLPVSPGAGSREWS
jgi:hypothetical protein